MSIQSACGKGRRKLSAEPCFEYLLLILSTLMFKLIISILCNGKIINFNITVGINIRRCRIYGILAYNPYGSNKSKNNKNIAFKVLTKTTQVYRPKEVQQAKDHIMDENPNVLSNKPSHDQNIVNTDQDESMHGIIDTLSAH